MKILMYGWEFPPRISGGLGVACYGIVKALVNHGHKLTLVLPSLDNIILTDPRLTYRDAFAESASSPPFTYTSLHPYLTTDYNARTQQHRQLYSQNLLAEIYYYAQAAGKLAANTPHDIIHAHDWLTVLAGVHAKKISGKPFIFHVHALESDRNPNGNGNKDVIAIEKQGLEAADHIIAVSEYTKNNIVNDYGISPHKISVVYNGIEPRSLASREEKTKTNAVVLFLGRVTEQKGPYYFIEAAKKILNVRQDIEFVVAGCGDQLHYLIEEVARAGISSHVHFTGFLDPTKVDDIYRMSDVYVMPSVSEPFGISCLEAISHQLPVVISKQSGIAEILNHSLKVDVWDIDKLVDHIIALVDYPVLKDMMTKHAHDELKSFTWDASVKKIEDVYHQLI